MHKIPIHSPGFHGLLWAQALGAFNDNAFKILVALMAVSALPPGRSGATIAAVGALFILPFIVFSTFAGALADRYSKRRLLVFFKSVELVLMALSLPALYSRSLPALGALLFLMGVHSAFFSPVKLAILPELLEDRDLSHGNGLMQMSAFVGIMLGTVSAGLLLGRFPEAPHAASILFVAAASAGLLASLRVPEVPAAAPPIPGSEAGAGEPLFRLNFAAQALESLAAMRRRYGVYMATVGSAYFWFLAALFQMNMLVYGKELMGVGEATLSWLQVVVALGIGAGSYAAGRLSRDRVELGLVPLGALGLVLFCADLAFAYRSPARALADLLFFGASGGCFVVPLQSFIQQRSPVRERGRFIAVGNLLSFAAVLAASGFLWAFDQAFRLHAGQVFLVAAVMTLSVAVVIVKLLPDFLLRLALYPVSNGIYRIQVEGAENVPMEGPALLVSNHVSFVDAFLIGGATQRLVRFLMFRRYYDMPVVHWFYRAMGAIPISDRDSPKAMIESLMAARRALEAGKAVCIFAEGEITRHGQMLRFRKGFERIVQGLPVPVVPVHLDRVWGSIFSFEGGRVLFKRPRRIPYPVTVSFGKPLASSVSAHELRQAILELGVSAFRHRLEEKPPLPVAFAREARRRFFRFAMADSTGVRLSYGSALARALALGRALDRALPPGDRVGLLLPPSVPAALANLGLSLAGRIPVNLNYTASKDIVLACARKARAGRILTSRKFLEKIGWTPEPEMVFLEEVAASVSKAGAAALGLAALALPWSLFERLFLEKASGPLDRLATVMFTSGSTGDPKGVMLTHANVHANLEALGQVYQVRPEDRILGALPFFHSFGFTATLWFPLVSGFGAVYHYNPLDAKRIGDLVAEHRATILVGTPTFLLAYLRRVEAAKFESLRIVVAGAEKLREDVALAFEEKFGILPLEGYGCTELSPVAAANIPDPDRLTRKQKGTKPGTIGQPLPGVAMKVVDPDTGGPLPAGKPGLLLVKGPNVMKGYLDDPERTSQAVKDGYYVTGDIASIDEDGFVTITDRLSRFSKVAGEMVPHIKVEEKLHELAGTVDSAFVVMGVPDDKRGERLAVLYKPPPGAPEGPVFVEGLVKKLAEAGLPKLWIPDKDGFHPVGEFPLLGSGKIDMARLKALARELEKAA